MQYDSIDSAKLAHQSLWDVVFPPETGRKLVLEFIDFEKAEELIAEEENKASNSNPNSHDTQRPERKKSNGNNGKCKNIFLGYKIEFIND